MSWIEWLVLAAYATYVAEITLCPVPSEASTWQLFRPSASARHSENDLLARAQKRSTAHKLLVYLLPTAVCVGLFLLPIVCIFVPEVALAIGCRRGDMAAIAGAFTIVTGRALTFTAMLELHRAQRAGRPPRGPFTRSRNPGLVGMFLFYIGLCLVFGSWLLWLGLPFYVLNMHGRVRLEEAHLRAQDGDAFADYAARVPRYVGLCSANAGPPPVAQAQVAAWFDATYAQKGLTYLRPPRAYPVFVQLLGLERGQRLLDVACGPGLLLEAAIDRGLEASGVDLSANAIALAAARVPTAHVRVGNAERLPFAESAFDAVTCLGSIERFLDRERALREMLRVARPDARFCFLVRNASTLVWRVWREGLCRREVEGHQDALTVEQWRRLFAGCGFRVDDVLPDQWPRQRWRQLLPWWRPAPGRLEPIARPWWPLRWRNELIFVLRRAEPA